MKTGLSSSVSAAFMLSRSLQPELATYNITLANPTEHFPQRHLAFAIEMTRHVPNLLTLKRDQHL
jgi:hypothetical protein